MRPANPHLDAGGRRLRVLIVDDHDVVHWGFRLVLSHQPWVERCLGARTGDEALALTRRYEPHVAVVDLFVGGKPGADICARLREAWGGVKVLMVSGSERISPSAARAAGASGIVRKDLLAADIARAIKMVGFGLTVFPRQEPMPGVALSGREREVLDLIASGATNREIAGTLHLSPHTVKEHASTLYRKLQARNRAEAVQRAQRAGLMAG